MVKLTIQGKQSFCCVLPKKREENKKWKCSPPNARRGRLQSKQTALNSRIYDGYYYSSYSQFIIYQKIYRIREQTK